MARTRRRPEDSGLPLLRRLTAIETDECIPWTGLVDKDGYGVIGQQRAHVLACAMSNGPRPAGLQARHMCGPHPWCVNPRHLAWGTPKENTADRVRDGTMIFGEHHGRAKLTVAQVHEIRARLAAGDGPTAVARAYGVKVGTIESIKYRRNWKWLK